MRRVIVFALVVFSGCSTVNLPDSFFLSHNTYHYTSLSEYHDPSLWQNDHTIVFDSVGNIQCIYPDPIGPQYNAVTTSQYALACYDKWLKTSNDSARSMFFSQVQSLENMGKAFEGSLVFHYEFDWKQYGLKKPSMSGMTQGHAASVFVRAYAISKNDKYITLSRKSLAPLLIPVTQGGAFATTPENFPWMEEYPSEKPSLVLNGLMFALIGVLEHQKIDPSFPPKDNITAWIAALKNTIPFYEKDNWLLYDRLYQKPSDNNYMGIHILQMYQLYDLTQDPWFREKAKAWDRNFDWNLFFTSWGYPSAPLTHRVSN